ncbi:hypothetical protein GM418_18425 [Maribellus comscasis]|uniref:Uncharacterized protein n=1 Tax=Maribellus comscasis TaxID=2681766 RepID=A0A6I6K6F0_9BACT|nr:hypothetical protein [Maribellus comscasis]QGY45574.1 hypothetical protein GM418_18425 [Maribellus comscasis]
MKKFPSFVIGLIFLSVCSFAQQDLQQLRFDNNKYYYFREPGRSGNLSVDVASKIPGIILMSTDRSAVRRMNTGQTFTNGRGNPFYLFAVPALYEVLLSEDGNRYKFGQNGGEGDFNSAEVLVFRNNGTASAISVGRYIRPPVKFSISGDELFTDPSAVNYAAQQFLRVEASENRTAEIRINHQTERGNVFVCIFNEKGEFLAELNPKDKNDNSPTKSFVTAQTVYVIPLVGSKFTRQANQDLIQFEVGDPKEVATVKIEEI